MKSAKLKIVLHSGKGLKDVKHFGIMNPYAEIWISGDGIELKHKTNIAKKGDTDPVWECSMDFENVLMNKDYNLFIEIKHDGTVFDRKIGVAQVSFAYLLDEDKSGDRVTYWLTTKSGEKQGQIILSYSFSDVVMKPDEDGSNTSTSQVPVAPVKKKREKAKKVLETAATKISTIAVEMAAATIIGEMIDLDGEGEGAK